MTTNDYCRSCGETLTPINWHPSFQKRNNFICRKCWVTQVYQYWGKIEKYSGERFCSACGVKLTEENQFSSQKKYKRFLCKECAQKRQKKYLEKFNSDPIKVEERRKKYNEKQRLRNKKNKYPHRSIMEKVIKRELNGEEIVHHINFDHKDNREENLFLTDKEEHGEITFSVFMIMPELINKGVIMFDKEKKTYYINPNSL